MGSCHQTNTQCALHQISRMLLSVPLVIISTIGVISFLGTSLFFSRLSSSLSATLSGSSPERISPYIDPTLPIRYPPVQSSISHTRHTYPPYSTHRTRRSTTQSIMDSILLSLDCPDQLSCQVYKLSQSQDYPIMASIIRPFLHQMDVDVYEKVICSDLQCY